MKSILAFLTLFGMLYLIVYYLFGAPKEDALMIAFCSTILGIIYFYYEKRNT